MGRETDEQKLTEILRTKGCCFGKQSFTHKPDGICRCPELQARLILSNTPGVARKLLDDNST